MKNWQFCGLLSAIYISPVVSDWVNVAMSGVFIVATAIAAWRNS